MASEAAIQAKIKEAFGLDQNPSIQVVEEWSDEFSFKPVFLVPNSDANLPEGTTIDDVKKYFRVIRRFLCS